MRLIPFLGWFLGSALPSDVPQTPSELVMVNDQRSSYQIVCTPDSLPATLLAAAELQNFVAASTGARLPIVDASQRGPRSIVVQHEACLPRESFTIEVVGEDLVIRGFDSPGDPRKIDFDHPVSTGTLSGVYEFLETTLGVRFYWPGELGTVIPRRDRLVVPSCLRVQESPHFALRRLRAGPGVVDDFTEDATGIWGRRLRLGASQPYRFYHAWTRILDTEEWARKGHPEYAALVDGQRQTKKGEGKLRRHGQVCTSNPEVQEIFVKAAKASKDPMFSISPNDGYGNFCQCASCRALDNGRTNPDGKCKGMPDLSDRIMSFYNVVAEAAQRPLGGYAYNDYLEVPAHTALNSQVTISVVLNNALVSARADELTRAERVYRAWGKYLPRASAYDILYTGLKMDEHIAPLGEDVDKRIRLIADSGLAGAQFYIAPEMELAGPDAYVAAKLLWDPRADGSQIRDEYYRDLYGPAAKSIHQFYDLAASQWRKAVQEQGKKRMLRVQLKIIPELRRLLEQAEKESANDALVTRRLQRFRRALDHMEGRRS